jgi:hypothetical protein
VLNAAAKKVPTLSDVEPYQVGLVVDNCDFWMGKRVRTANQKSTVLNTVMSGEIGLQIPQHMEPVQVVGILSQLKQWAPTVPYSADVENQLCGQIFDRLTHMCDSGKRLGMPSSPSNLPKTKIHILPVIVKGKEFI